MNHNIYLIIYIYLNQYIYIIYTQTDPQNPEY
jgi:hypothetical protein